MRYKCFDCGFVFDEDEIETISESRGEYWGCPCREDIEVCPNCKSPDIDEYDESEDEE